MNNYANDYTKELRQYKEQSVNTMTRGEMLILLYDEVIKRLNRAKVLLEKKDYSLFEKEVERARDIVFYLNQSLNRQYTISMYLSKLYDFMIYEFSRLTAGRRPEIIDEVLPLVVELRDTYKEADRLAKHNSPLAPEAMMKQA